MDTPNWHGKLYYSLDSYCKNTFHHKCYKVALNAHMTCPNRDGTLDTRGCIFCSAGGSGDFAVDVAGSGTTVADGVICGNSAAYGNDARGRYNAACSDISTQLQAGLALLSQKWAVKRLAAPSQPCIIAYFQAYTNTYAPAARLEALYREALDEPAVVGISIGTRPDCLGGDVFELLDQLNKEYRDKQIWIELGLQTIHEDTAALIRRGYPLTVFEQAVTRLKEISLPIIAHVIIGLPGEDRAMMFETCRYLSERGISGIKLQLLHILKNTDLVELYRKKTFDIPDMMEYIDIIISCLEILPPGMVIHRVTGDGPKNMLLAPLWSLDKRRVLNTLHQEMRRRGTWQSKAYKSGL